jgi:hypothetical protein
VRGSFGERGKVTVRAGGAFRPFIRAGGAFRPFIRAVGARVRGGLGGNGRR